MFDSERDDSPEHLGKALPKNTKISTFSWYVLLKQYFMLACITSARK